MITAKHSTHHKHQRLLYQKQKFGIIIRIKYITKTKKNIHNKRSNYT